MGTPSPVSQQPKAVRAAAAKAASRGRRSSLRRWTRLASSKVAWVLVLLVAVYLGFFYSPRVLTCKYEVIGGPGLDPAFAAPTRHFRIAVRNDSGGELPIGFKKDNIRLTWHISPSIPGRAGQSVASELYDLGGGEFQVAFRVKEGVPSGHELRLRISYADKQTPISIPPLDISVPGPIHEPSCTAPVQAFAWTQAMGCPRTFPQLEEDLKSFETIDLGKLRQAIPKLLQRSSATSLLHYVIKDNQVFKKAHGPFPAFSYFADMVFHQLAATVKLPDVEFVLNVGDWPLVEKSWGEGRVPVFSWCGSTGSFDIVLPQWDVSRSTILGNTESDPDLLASQGWSLHAWESKDSRAAFRGRDSNPVRVKLAQLSALHPDLLDVAITSWENDENFEAEEQLGGGSKKFIKLSEFSKYKYILELDGTVAAYRNPYLLASGSLVLKQDSAYYEWYQRELSPWQHFVPFNGTGEDLLSKLQWAKENDAEAKRIASNARQYAKISLLPERVLCFYYKALESYALRQVGTPTVMEDMVWVPPPQLPKYNTCGSPDPLSRLGDYPVVPLHPTSVETFLSRADKDTVVIVHSAFCNRSARILADILVMARMYRAAGADLQFASAETFTAQYPIKWIQTTNGPQLFFLKKGSSTPEQLAGQLTRTAAVTFINSKLPDVQHHIIAPPEVEQIISDPIPQRNDGPAKQIVANTFGELVLGSDKDVLLMVSAPWCGYCKKIRPAFFRFARAVSANPAAAAVLEVAKMNGPTNEIRHKGFAVTHYPTIWFVRKGEKQPVVFSGRSTEEGFLEFVKKHATNPADLEGIVTTPKPPSGTKLSMKDLQSKYGSPILTVDSESFYDDVLDNDKDVLLLVYAPWCGHCKKLEPTYEEFAKLAAESKSANEALVVAKMDGSANRLPDEKYKVTGFPTVWFFKKGSDTPIKFMGERTANGLASFVQQHATTKIEMKIPAPPAPVAVSQPAPTTNDGPVKVVVGDTFKSQVLDSGKDVLLLVYAPWCGHCKKLEPTYEEFAKLVAESKSANEALVVARMDGSANRLPDEKYKVTGFPTVWFFKKGSDTPIKFMGERTANGLASFVQQHATTKIEMKIPAPPAPVAVPQPAPTTNDGPVKVVVGDTFKSQVLDSGKDVLLLVYAPWCGHCKKLEPTYEEFAKLVAESKSANEALVVARMDGSANRLPDEKYKVTGFPTVWFFKKGSDTPIKFMGERTANGLASFVQQHATTKIEMEIPAPPAPVAVSQPAPTTNDGPVKVVVGDTFKSQVLDSGKDVLLLVYAPWCGHCKKLEPTYEEFAKLVAESKSANEALVVAKMDGSANRLPDEKYKVTGFPTVWFFKKGSDTPIKFMGERTANGLASFVQQHATTKIEMKIPAPPAPVAVSQPAPTTNDGPVKVVVGDTFKSQVLDSGKDVLLLVYAPWCGHCKKLEPTYEEFAKLVAESKSANEALVVARMDGSANRLPDEKYKVTGFPTVWFFKKGSDTPIKFMGERTANGLASFVQQHATTKIEMKIPAPPAPVAVSQPAPTTNDGPVKVVVGDTFKSQVLDSGKDVLLLVYAPWCGHCKKLEPTYEEFAKLVAESKSANEALVVAKMDGSANRLPDEKYKVTGFPTVWFFKKGSDTPIEFMGERTANGLASFVQQHATTKIEMEIPAPPAPVAVSQPAPTTNDGPVKVVVGDTFKSQVLDSGKDVLLLVYAPWCGHCKKLEPTYEEFAKLVAESKSANEALVVARMDGSANRLPDEKYKVTGFPTVWFFKKGSDTPIKFMGERTANGLASFVQQHATTKIEMKIPAPPAPVAVSQPAPTTNDGPVKVVVGDTFKSQVLDSGKDVLLLVYAPWCGHCKKLEPTYEEFAKLVAESKSANEALVVAKMDGSANRLPDEKYKVTGFPTVWFFKKGSDTPIEFMGERTANGLASFVQQHSSVSGRLFSP